MKGPSAEGPIVRRVCYVLAGFSAMWLMVALSVGGAFSAPLVGTLVFGFFAITMYMKEQDTEQIREARRVGEAGAARKGDTSRWEVEDSGGDPTQPPKILES